MKILHRIIILIVAISSSNVCAYKEPTHKDMSSKALNISVLSTDQTLLLDLGLQAFNSEQLFINPDAPNSDKLTLEELVRNGAEFEDRFPRSLNHFFNPTDNTPLIFLGKEAGNTSPDWALEDNGDVDPNLSGEQEYSYKEANNYFFKALTESTEETREENWGKLFQTLGQVIHHVQDMAQPQHVRNDEHLTDPSWYEEYSNDIKGKAHFTGLMSGNAYPIPEFNTAREFWTTTSDEGIADFTNLNFVSNDTNFNIKDNALSTNALFDLPAPRLTRNTETLTNLLNDGGITCQDLLDTGPIDLPANADCIVEFIETDVTDNKNPTYNNVNMRAASLSLYDEYLDKYNISDMQIEPEENHLIDIDEVPTLNRFNYDAAHQYLIPRAVSYSAGLLNHFFAKRFTVTVDTINKKYVLKNISGNTMYGNFFLYGELLNDTDNLQLTQTWVTPPSGLNDNSELMVDIPNQALYKPDFKIVFRGKLGETEQIDYVSVVSTKNLSIIMGYSSYFWDGDFSTATEQTSIKTIYLYEYNTYEFEMSITQNIMLPSNTYFTDNYFWTLRPPASDYQCVIEVSGNKDITAALGQFGFGFYLSAISSLGDGPSFPFIGITTPTSLDCDSASFGYRTASWNEGWISKFPKIDNVELDFRIENSDLTPQYIVVSYNNFNKYNDVTEECDLINQMDKVNQNWNNTNISSNIHKHTYASKAALLLDDPNSFLNQYISDEVIDYRCR